MKKTPAVLIVITSLALMTAQAEEAKVIYDKQCVKCHGADGKGDTKMGRKVGVKDYTDPKVQAELKDDAAFKAIKEGVKDGDKTKMKAAENLSDQEIKSLVAYVRAFKK